MAAMVLAAKAALATMTAERAYDLNKAAELKYSTLLALEKQLADASAAAGPPADKAGQIHDCPADEVAQDDGRKGLGKAQRCQKHARQDFSDGNAGAEP